MNQDVIIKKTFGRACKYFREKKNLSQEKFSLFIGMDRTYYASVELGKRNISIINIQKICKGFDIPMSELFKIYESYIKEESNAGL